MTLDEFTRKRINNFIEQCLHETLHNEKSEVRNFASGTHHGIIKTLSILGVDIDEEIS